MRWRRHLLSPQNRDVRPSQPYQASVGAVAACWLTGAAARRRSINPRLISSHFHQRRSPSQIRFRTRISGTNPSYNSRQPAFLLP